MRKIDLTGQRFGRWTVLDEAEENKHGHIFWLCRCDCGTERAVYQNDLRAGKSKSCGCFRMPKHNGAKKRNIEPLYVVWCGMKQRCNNPKHKWYSRYGGRGIRVCDEWKNDYGKFRDWALKHGYMKGRSIDRIDNDGNYCPENCRWVSTKENNKNTSKNRWIEIEGETKLMTEWAKEVGVKEPIASYHLKKGEAHFIEYIQKKLKEK